MTENAQKEATKDPIDEGMQQAQEELKEIEALTNEQLTIQFAMMKTTLDRVVNSHNQLLEYVNNLQENPAFVGGLLAHINDLVDNQQVFFVEVHQSLPEEDQKRCYRATLFLDDDAEKAEDKVDLSLEVYDGVDEQWQTIVDGDPIQEALREAVIARMLLMGSEHGQPYFITIQNVMPSDGDLTDAQSH